MDSRWVFHSGIGPDEEFPDENDENYEALIKQRSSLLLRDEIKNALLLGMLFGYPLEVQRQIVMFRMQTQMRILQKAWEILADDDAYNSLLNEVAADQSLDSVTSSDVGKD